MNRDFSDFVEDDEEGELTNEYDESNVGSKKVRKTQFVQEFLLLHQLLQCKVAIQN
jgi:hypothetical protein